MLTKKDAGIAALFFIILSILFAMGACWQSQSNQPAPRVYNAAESVEN